MDFQLVQQLKSLNVLNESHSYFLTWIDKEGKKQEKTFTIYKELKDLKDKLEKDGIKSEIEVLHYGEDR